VSNGNALALVKHEKDKGALVFANMENLEAQVELYRTEVTVLTFTDKDFHTINGKQMPSKAATDRIGEAFGIQFIQAACRVSAETREDELCGKRTVYCAEAQGKVRMPDGSWRTSTVDEYEFDPVLRAMLDKNVTELNERTKPTVAKAILEYSKVARQRAATGARLRVIRQLTGMPAAFDKAEAGKPFVFTRVVQNTDYILKTPEGRTMATAQALGIDISSLFGKPTLPSPTVTTTEIDHTPSGTTDSEPEQENQGSTAGLAAQASGDEEPEFPDDPAGPGTPPERAELERLTAILVEWTEGYKDALDVESKNGKNPYKMAEEELNNPNATIESRGSMIERLRTWLKAKGHAV
jgi:hypothetical protein